VSLRSVVVVVAVRCVAGERAGPGQAEANRLATVTRTAIEMIRTGARRLAAPIRRRARMAGRSANCCQRLRC
jgi:hypothetical protein